MEFLKLEILNLASLDKEGGEVINFTEGALKESTIFSIVGPTGSGKSTILDAICLALYNRAPRYIKDGKSKAQKIKVFGEGDGSNALSPNDNRNILTRGKKEGYSKLTFRTNNGYIYRAEYHVKFNRTRYDKDKTLLYKITFADDIPHEEVADWNDLPQIIGLDYDQFLRTVLIAQGSFANFLTAKEDERFELLEKLTGTGAIYVAIAKAINNQKEIATEAYNLINAENEAMRQNLLPDDDLSALVDHIAHLEQQERHLSEGFKQTEQALAWYTKDEELCRDINNRKQQVAQAQQALATTYDAVQRLKMHDALLPAINMMSEAKRIETAITQLTIAIEKDTKEAESQRSHIAQDKDLLSTLKADAETAERELKETQPLINKARELKAQLQSAAQVRDEKIALRNSATQALETAKSAVEENRKAIAQAEEQVSKAIERQQQLQEQINTKRQTLAEAAEQATENLSNERQKIESVNIDTLQNNKAHIDEMVAHINTAIDIIDKQTKVQEELNNIIQRKTLLTDANAQIEEQLGLLHIESLTIEVETIRKTYTLMTSENWTHHRATLKPIQPCPLCGATEHPYAEDMERYEEATSELKLLLASKTEELSNQQAQREKLKTQKSDNEGQLKVITDNITRMNGELANCEHLLHSLYAAHPTLPRTKAELEVQASEYKTRQEQTNKTINQYNQIQKEIDRLGALQLRAIKEQNDYVQHSNDQLEQSKQAVNTCQRQHAEKSALAPTLQRAEVERAEALEAAKQGAQQATDNFTTLQAEYNKTLGGADPDTIERHLTKKSEQAGQAVVAKTEVIAALENGLSKLQGSLQSQHERKQQDTASHQRLLAELDQWVALYNTREERIREVTKEDVATILSATDNWEATRAHHEQLTQELTQALTLQDNAAKLYEVHQHAKPEKNREELTSEQLTMQEQRMKLTEQLIQAQATKSSHDKAVQQMGHKADELRQREAEKNEWEEISAAIGAEGKVVRKIAQTYTLSFLIEHANAEIRKFNSRYELEQVPRSLGIRVIDHDRADDVRDTTSLSGGETFIVSLGLALGLSSLSTRNISFANLFIDEGFGTLDPDTLDSVIDSLSMLQVSQGKKVGVISHTYAMSERITTQIRVIKNGNSGSSHIEVYP